ILNLNAQAQPFLGKVWDAYYRSLILLFSAMFCGIALGVPLGLVVGTRPRTLIGRTIGLVSYLATLTTSFLFGLAVMVFFVRFLGANTGLQWIIIAPSPGLPEPREIIAPALTLAARPIAHIAQVTAIQIQEQLRLGYVHTAQGKGLPGRRVLF